MCRLVQSSLFNPLYVVRDQHVASPSLDTYRDTNGDVTKLLQNPSLLGIVSLKLANRVHLLTRRNTNWRDG